MLLVVDESLSLSRMGRAGPQLTGQNEGGRAVVITVLSTHKCSVKKLVTLRRFSVDQN
jgi:hypothetical protein